MNNYDRVKYRADEHADLVNTIPAETHLKFHNIFRHFNPHGQHIVDLGCGDGSVARAAVENGAQYVLGIDSRPDMIAIAQEKNIGFEDRIEYRVAFVEVLEEAGSFDTAILSYLLNNAQNYEQLLAQCRGVASCLRSGGLAVVFNNNPFDTTGGDFSQYGFKKQVRGLEAGDKVIFDYRPAISEPIINYYLSPQDHVRAFIEAGFSQFMWKPLQLYVGADEEFWKEYFSSPDLPVIGMVVKK